MAHFLVSCLILLLAGGGVKAFDVTQPTFNQNDIDISMAFPYVSSSVQFTFVNPETTVIGPIVIDTSAYPFLEDIFFVGAVDSIIKYYSPGDQPFLTVTNVSLTIWGLTFVSLSPSVSTAPLIIHTGTTQSHEVSLYDCTVNTTSPVVSVERAGSGGAGGPSTSLGFINVDINVLAPITATLVKYQGGNSVFLSYMNVIQPIETELMDRGDGMLECEPVIVLVLAEGGYGTLDHFSMIGGDYSCTVAGSPIISLSASDATSYFSLVTSAFEFLDATDRELVAFTGQAMFLSVQSTTFRYIAGTKALVSSSGVMFVGNAVIDACYGEYGLLGTGSEFLVNGLNVTYSAFDAIVAASRDAYSNDNRVYVGSAAFVLCGGDEESALVSVDNIRAELANVIVVGNTVGYGVHAVSSSVVVSDMEGNYNWYMGSMIFAEEIKFSTQVVSISNAHTFHDAGYFFAGNNILNLVFLRQSSITDPLTTYNNEALVFQSLTSVAILDFSLEWSSRSARVAPYSLMKCLDNPITFVISFMVPPADSILCGTCARYVLNDDEICIDPYVDTSSSTSSSSSSSSSSNAGTGTGTDPNGGNGTTTDPDFDTSDSDADDNTASASSTLGVDTSSSSSSSSSSSGDGDDDTSSPPSSSSSSAFVNCSSSATCDECLLESDCVWCGASSACVFVGDEGFECEEDVITDDCPVSDTGLSNGAVAGIVVGSTAGAGAAGGAGFLGWKAYKGQLSTVLGCCFACATAVGAAHVVCGGDDSSSEEDGEKKKSRKAMRAPSLSGSYESGSYESEASSGYSASYES